MNTLIHDIRYAWRQLRKNPGFTVVAALTLAIGIGANITMFSVVNAVLLRPLPFQEADRLVVIKQRNKPADRPMGFSYPEFLDLREQNQVFDEFAAYTPARFDLIEDDKGASKIDGATVSGDFFSLLKVSAYLGRTFTRADEQQNTEPVAVVSHDFWRSRLGQAQEVLGRTITLHDKIYVIIGVLPPGFHFPESIGNAQIWTVLNPTGEQLTNRSYWWLCTTGRLKADLSIQQALPRLNALQKRLTEHHGTGNSEVLMHGLRDMVVHGVRTTLWILSAIVGFILLIVCANVANLCLAKASSRDREVAVRRALGANRLRLLRQFTTESILLSLTGGAMGLIITAWTVAFFKMKIANFVPMADSIRVQPQELLFGLGLSLLVGVLLGIAPFWFMQRPRLVNILTERRSISGHHATFSHMLISGQIAMALILSIGMGLMIRSMVRFSSADTGFNWENLVTFSIGMGKRDEAQRFQFSRDFLERLSALPYVKAVSTDSWTPCYTGGPSSIVAVEGYASPDGKPIPAVFHDVSEDYFSALQIPIRRGRGISPQEHQNKEKVVVINESLAQLFWADEDPIGRELTFCEQQFRIVGVAADMIQGNVKLDKPNQLFFPFDTFYALLTMFLGPDLKVVVRTDSDPGPVIEQARAILRDIDSTQPLYDVSTFQAQMNKCVSQERFTTAFLAIFASIALLLIVIGIYGVVSYAVAQRTREIGIRMALGAQKAGILTMVLKQGLVLLTIGLVIGLAGAIGLTRFLSSYLYEVSTTDPVTFVVVPLLIITVSLLACLIPARRAAKIDPMEALRYE